MTAIATEFSKGQFDCPVLSIKNLVGEIYLMRMHCPAIAQQVLPGQFINIKVNNEFIPFLRKPFSVCRRDAKKGWLEVVWKIVGKGTQIMANFQAGESINVIGPLGKGYHIAADLPVALLVAGGLGVAPLPFLCEELLKQRKPVELFLGAKSHHELSFVEEFQEMGANVFVATEDGSVGKKGLVTELLMERLAQQPSLKNGTFFGCGPTGLLNRMTQISADLNMQCQIAIETMMGCGFGICVGCPVRIRNPRTGESPYKLTCIDGPVFDAREVLLDG
jgi:dihydroorotate dehydrogenase electron transfer subunit